MMSRVFVEPLAGMVVAVRWWTRTTKATADPHSGLKEVMIRAGINPNTRVEKGPGEGGEGGEGGDKKRQKGKRRRDAGRVGSPASVSLKGVVVREADCVREGRSVCGYVPRPSRV